MSFGFGFGFPRRAAAGGAAPSLNFDFTSLTSLPSRITFSRTSNATLTDSNGRVAYAPHNLLTNSEDFEAAAWTKTNATVSANATVSPDGTTTADKLVENNLNAAHAALQTTATIVAGARQTFSIYAKAGERNKGRIFCCNGAANSGFQCDFDLIAETATAGANVGTGAISGSPVITSIGSGWYRITVSGTIDSSSTTGGGYIYLRDAAGSASYTGDGTSGIFIWGAQLNVANAPVNLLTFSEQFDNAVWNKQQSTISANSAIAPDGASSADKVIPNNGFEGYVFRGTTITSGTVAFSIYVKAAEWNFVFVSFGASFSPTNGTYIRLSDGVVTSGSGFTAQSVGNGWYRISGSSTYSSAADNSVYVIPTNSGVAPRTTGDGTSGILIWGAQLNTGSTALPYVATTSSIFLPPSYNSTTPKNLLGFTQEFDNAAWTKSNSSVQTNLLTWSEQFDNAAWLKDGTNTTVVTPNTQIAPDGTLTADTVTFGGTQPGSNRIYQNSATNAVNGTSYTASIWLRAPSSRPIEIAIERPGPADTEFVVVTATTEWQRFTFTHSTTWTFSAALRFRLSATTVAGDFYVWGAQLVQGSVPGDYQVTTSAAAAVQYSDPNGTRTADKLVEDTAASSTHLLLSTTDTAVINGTRYISTIYAKAGERSWFQLQEGQGVTAGAYFNITTGVVGTVSGTGSPTASITSIGSGWYRCSLSWTASGVAARLRAYLATGDGTAIYTGDGTSGIYIWGAQLSNSASVDPYVYNPQAAPTSTAYYGPRFDYNPVTLAANGLLIEDARTNLLTYSEDFSNAVWVNNGGTVTSNALVAPDGTTTADYLVRSTASGDGRYQTISAGTSGVLTASVYIKKDTAVNSAIWIYDATAVADRAFATITWSGSTPTLTATTGTAGTPVDAGNGWWRISITSTALVGANTNRFYLLPAYTASSNGQQTAFWGAQLEAGSTATTYIPTVASQVTRAADSAVMLGDNFLTWFNFAQGTVAASWDVIGIDTTLRRGVWGTTDTGNQRLALRALDFAVSNPIAAVGTGTTVVSLNGVAYAANTPVKVAIAYGSNSALAQNGGNLATDASANSVAGTSFSIGTTSAGSPLNGHIRSISYYPTRLANATLVSITS